MRARQSVAAPCAGRLRVVGQHAASADHAALVQARRLTAADSAARVVPGAAEPADHAARIRARTRPAADARARVQPGAVPAADARATVRARTQPWADARVHPAQRSSAPAPVTPPAAPPDPYQVPDAWAWDASLTSEYAAPDSWAWDLDLRPPTPDPRPRWADRTVRVRRTALGLVIAHPDRRTVVLPGRARALPARPGVPALPIVVPLDPPLPRWIVPWRLAYLMHHDIRLTRASDGVDIPCSQFSLTAHADQWADTLTATAHGDDVMDLLGASEAVELLLSVDGETWRVVVDDPARALTHTPSGVQIRARSLTALLDLPHQDRASGTQPDARTIAQLAAEALPSGEGWTMTWTAADWLIPGGLWTWADETPAARIARLAGVLRAAVRPTRDGRAITVQSRYPVAPWDYAGATPGLVLADGLWLDAGQRLPRADQANAVYLQGGAQSGIQARVYRSLTAGDRYAATIQHDLLTHQDAASERGAVELAEHYGDAAIASAVLPFDGGTDWPLVEIGTLVEITHDGTAHRDTVLGHTLTGSLTDRSVDLRQTLTLRGAPSPAYSRLRAMTAAAPLLVATVTTAHGDGTATVAYPGGGTQRVRGTATAGASVWVRAGVIEGEAPTLPAYDLGV